MPVRFIVFLTIACLLPTWLTAQDDYQADIIAVQGEEGFPDDTLGLTSLPDSLVIADSTLSDSIIVSTKPRKSALDSELSYTADDSIKVSLNGEKIYLFGNAHIIYQNIDLTAEYIELDYAKEVVFAKGRIDSVGAVIGAPIFTQGKENFESDSLAYNFNSENGIIYHIITEQGEGYLHSDKTKRHADGHIHLQDGKYTTCDARHPHFYMALSKGIMVPDDKIITGHAYMVIADVPLKVVGVPFGFFPNTTSRASGILIPTYGSEERRGFYLRNLGWYQVMGEYADLRILSDYYTKGSWAVRSNLSYRLRYKFSGGFAFNYAYNEIDDDLSYVPSKDYGIRWNHRQDPKANPTRTFSSNVNFTSRNYDQNHSTNTQSRLTNNKTSSISYTKRWPGSPFNFSMSANANQNSQTNITRLSLPTGAFNVSTQFPLRGLSSGGKSKWYESLSYSYSSRFENVWEDSTSLLLEKETWDLTNLENGFSHTIPLSLSLKLGKLITISPSMSYRGMMYTKKVLRTAVFDTLTGRPVESISEIVPGFKALHSISPTIGASFTPKMYGYFSSKKQDSYMETVRHVITPIIGASYTPDIQNEKLQPIFKPDYYEALTYIDTSGNMDTLRMYSPWENEAYGVPSSPGKSASIRLALNNNLEMKVRPKNDTTGESKKVSILDNLNFSTSYNPFADQFKWSDVSMTTGTRLFKSKLDIRVSGRFSPYALDEDGRRINEFYFNTNKKILRFTNMSISSGFSLKSKVAEKAGEETDEDESYMQDDQFRDIDLLDEDINMARNQLSDAYVDFDIPWTLRFDYSWSLNKTSLKPVTQQTIRARGDFSITPKWKIGGQTGYDLEAKEISYTTINIYRDLHCWEMRFTVIPIGRYASYSFTIQAKGSLLSDLKYDREPNWYDQF